MSISDTHTFSGGETGPGRRPDAGLHNGMASWDGGARRDRTDDLKLAKLALSQLSYGPNPFTRAEHTKSKHGGPGKI